MLISQQQYIGLVLKTRPSVKDKIHRPSVKDKA